MANNCSDLLLDLVYENRERIFGMIHYILEYVCSATDDI